MESVDCSFVKLNLLKKQQGPASKWNEEELDLLFEIGLSEQLAMGSLEWDNFHVINALCQVRPTWQEIVQKQYYNHLARGKLIWTKMECFHHDYQLAREFPTMLATPNVQTACWKVVVSLATLALNDAMVRCGPKIWDLVVHIDEYCRPADIGFLHRLLVLTPELRKLEVFYEWAFVPNEPEGALMPIQQKFAELEFPELKYLSTLIIRRVPRHPLDFGYDVSENEFPRFQLIKNKLIDTYGKGVDRVLELTVGRGQEPDVGLGYVACTCGRHLSYNLHPDTMEYKALVAVRTEGKGREDVNMNIM